MADLSELPQDQMLSGTRYDEQPQDGLSNAQADEEIETPVLIVGGGPVGMLLAYTLSAYHGVSCVLAEQSSTTTKYPKMVGITRLKESLNEKRARINFYIGIFQPSEYGDLSPSRYC
jgi:hypothetical protein